jgi:ribosomal protein S1
MRPGEVITAEVVRIEHNFVVVNAGLKSEAYVPLEEFKSATSCLWPSALSRTATATPF